MKKQALFFLLYIVIPLAGFIFYADAQYWDADEISGMSVFFGLLAYYLALNAHRFSSAGIKTYEISGHQGTMYLLNTRTGESWYWAPDAGHAWKPLAKKDLPQQTKS